ncbi:MAG TPA: Gfo/Idh/MocA family oxidoreductase [Planctomycetia bacterium]|nr:Gfo/Idh/MocA family oxidoreductase [Planctomycetia bacterium]
MSETNQESRRDFLATAAVAAAAPTIVPSTVFGRPNRPAPSDQIVVGIIGTGDLARGYHLPILNSKKQVKFGPVCDVDRNHRDLAAKQIFEMRKERVDTYNDFRDLCDRKDVDAVVVVTPDHWHTLTSLCAMQSGKDVYCQKPLTLFIDEGKKLVEVARQMGTVFQTGSQQRSDNRFRLACELVRSGTIGKLSLVDTVIGNIDSGAWQSPTTPPPELDWDRWLGPAPYAEYVPNRVHYQFRWFSDYSGGKLTDWGAHHNDIAQWGIGADGSGPVKIKGAGQFHADGPHDVAGEFDVNYTYGSQHGNVEVFCHSQGENGVKFTGSDGWIFVSRERIEMQVGGKTYIQGGRGKTGLDIFKEFPEDKLSVKLTKSGEHHDNWLECIKTRERPICDVEIGHRSCTVCHLGNIALKLGRELEWDPAAEKFVNDEQANRLTSRPLRAPWTL